MIKVFPTDLQKELENHQRWVERADPATERQPAEKAISKQLEWAGEDLRHLDLTGARLEDAVLAEARLHFVPLRGANLAGANLASASLIFADLREAMLGKATLDGAECIEMRAHEVSAIRTSFLEADLRRADFSSADLRGADLSGADLREASLADASLDNAHLTGARLAGAKLRGVRGGHRIRAEWIDVGEDAAQRFDGARAMEWIERRVAWDISTQEAPLIQSESSHQRQGSRTAQRNGVSDARLKRLLQEELRSAGFEPRLPTVAESGFDLMWHAGGTVFLGDIEAFGPKDEEGELQFALGQVLRRRQSLRLDDRTTILVVAIVQEPSDLSWVDLFARDNVGLTWLRTPVGVGQLERGLTSTG